MVVLCLVSCTDAPEPLVYTGWGKKSYLNYNIGQVIVNRGRGNLGLLYRWFWVRSKHRMEVATWGTTAPSWDISEE